VTKPSGDEEMRAGGAFRVGLAAGNTVELRS
jgi:hypothetical protein